MCTYKTRPPSQMNREGKIARQAKRTSAREAASDLDLKKLPKYLVYNNVCQPLYYTVMCCLIRWTNITEVNLVFGGNILIVTIKCVVDPNLYNFINIVTLHIVPCIVIFTNMFALWKTVYAVIFKCTCFCSEEPNEVHLNQASKILDNANLTIQSIPTWKPLDWGLLCVECIQLVWFAACAVACKSFLS